MAFSVGIDRPEAQSGVLDTSIEDTSHRAIGLRRGTTAGQIIFWPDSNRMDQTMSRTALAALAIFFLAACSSETTVDSEPLTVPGSTSSIEETVFSPDLQVDLDASQRTETGLYWREITAGTGEIVTAGQVVDVYYEGWLSDGTRFDGKTTGDPVSFPIGIRQVIDGWDQGVVGMNIGSKRQLVIPPSLGYGATGTPGGPIPPNAVLVFTVEVIAAR